MGDQRDGGIAWTDQTWNPLRGCSRVSEGCRNCYAETVAARFSGPGQPYDGLAVRSPARWTGKVRLVEEHLADPLRWSRPRKIFVNSMSDLFHQSVPDEWIDRVFAVMALAPRHTFQVLTKRPERMRVWVDPRAGSRYRVTQVMHEIGREIEATWTDAALRRSAYARTWQEIEQGEGAWPLPNVWLGTSVEDQPSFDARWKHLRDTPAAVRFLSYEPALAAIDLEPALSGFEPSGTEYGHGFNHTRVGRAVPKVDWIIIGGESGPGARPFDVSWARSTITQCKAAGVACFVKQLGACAMHEIAPNCDALIDLRDRKGGDPSEWPEDLRCREFPRVPCGA